MVRFRSSVKPGKVLFLRSLEPFEGKPLAVAVDAGYWLEPI